MLAYKSKSKVGRWLTILAKTNHLVDKYRDVVLPKTVNTTRIHYDNLYKIIAHIHRIIVGEGPKLVSVDYLVLEALPKPHSCLNIRKLRFRHIAVFVLRPVLVLGFGASRTMFIFAYSNDHPRVACQGNF